MKLNWRQGILYVTTIGMESCWLYALMTLLNKRVVDSRLSIPGILVLYPVAFLFNTVLLRLKWPKVSIMIISWLGWVVGMLLILKVELFGYLPLSDPQWLLSVPWSITEIIHTFRPELLILLSTGVLWWLGWWLARRVCNFAAMVSEFQFGLIMLVIILFVIIPLQVTLDNAVPTVLSFSLFALLGISVAHASEGASWLSGLHRGHWSGLLLISIALIILVGLLISVVVTPDLVQTMWDAAKWIVVQIYRLMLSVMKLIARLFPEQAELPTGPEGSEAEVEKKINMFDMIHAPEWLKKALLFSWYALLLGLVLAALWSVSSDIFRWLRRRLTGMAGVEFEPLPGAFKADFLSLLKRILSKFLRLKLPFRLRAKKGIVSPAVASVRQIYRQLLRWAAASGYPRLVSQTPHEYFSTLVSLLPEAKGDLDLVTQQYVRARYGASTPTGDELYELNQAWQRLKQTRPM